MKFIRKNMRGNWMVTEVHEVGERRRLTVRTCKRDSGSIDTVASVATRDPLDDRFLIHAVHKDFYKRIGSSRFRATSKAVEEHHVAMVEQAGGLETLKAEVLAYYAPRA